MKSFQHNYVIRTRAIWAPQEGGGLLIDTLIITVNIPLDPNHLLYDKSKVDDVETAAVMYAKSNKSSYKILFEEP